MSEKNMNVDDTSATTPVFASVEIEAYYQCLTEREQEGFRVATQQLGSTFDVAKTRGFLAWRQQQQQQQESGKKRKEI
jgi:hypothetical protein